MRTWKLSLTSTHHLLFLNQPCKKQVFQGYWKQALTKICADGGANHLYDSLSSEERASFIPDYIKGDLDSLRDDVKTFYESHGCKIIRDSSQEETDFVKCTQIIQTIEQKNENHDLIVIGGLDGRLDQTMDCINTLFSLKSRNTYVFGSESIAFLLDKGEHKIHTEHRIGKTCGLIPIGVPSKVTSKGLKWDLTDQVLSFGGLVSTSNSIEKDEISISTSEPLLWTMGL